jgi:ribonuclease PH
MNLVMTGKGNFVEVQATAEHQPFTDAQLAEMTAYARRGCARLVEIQKEALDGLSLP